MKEKYIISVKDLGLTFYSEALKIQESIFNENVSKKTVNGKTKNIVFFTEHYPVITIGKSGKTDNLLKNTEFLKRQNIDFYKTTRGGDVTFHGPGQLVIYPVIDLEKIEISIKSYVFYLEEIIINVLKRFNIETKRIEGATGIWVNDKKKICAIGIKASRYITMHGIALNVNNDLNYFNYINPCGFKDKGVTSMALELGRTVDMGEIKKIVIKEFFNVFNLKKEI